MIFERKSYTVMDLRALQCKQQIMKEEDDAVHEILNSIASFDDYTKEERMLHLLEELGRSPKENKMNFICPHCQIYGMQRPERDCSSTDHWNKYCDYLEDLLSPIITDEEPIPAVGIVRNMENPESRTFWANVEQTAELASKMPEWSKVGLQLNEENFQTYRQLKSNKS